MEMEYPSMTETAEQYLESDFNHQNFDMAGAQADISKLKELGIEEKTLSMLDYEVGNGRPLGASKTVLTHVRRAAQQIQRKVDEYMKPQGMYRNKLDAEAKARLRSEGLSILNKALMDARSEFIKRSRMSLPGW